MFVLIQHPSVQVAICGFILGVIFSVGVALIVYGAWYAENVKAYAAGVYIISDTVLFHMAEYISSAGMNRVDRHPGAFMLYHSREFTIAKICSLLEFVIECFLVPEEWKISRGGPLGLIFRLNFVGATTAGFLTIAFYLVRVWGMIQMGRNFSLIIETVHRSDHVLVKDGIYKYMRHPSYFGYFWKSLFAQMVLCNPLCLVLYTLVLWKFFHNRISEEECLLASRHFFGLDYKVYMEKTWSGIPFVRS